MNSKYAYAFAGLLLGLTACSNEDLTPSSGAGYGEEVFVSLAIDRSKCESRTIIEETDVENGVGLSNKWAFGDQVTLVAADGSVAGNLTLQGEGGSSEGVFNGTLTISSGEYDVWYLGDATTGEPYAKFENGKLVNALAAAGCSVSGDLSDLNKGDLLKSAEKVQIKVSEGKATVSNDVQLTAQMAMAHFTLTGDGIAALADNGSTLTFAYGDYSYNITNKKAEVYVPIIPGTYTPNYYTFTLTDKDGKKYTYSQANNSEKAIVAGLYYNGGKDSDSGKYKGVEIALTAPAEESDDNTVGPVIEINGKRYKFVKGNLYYDINDKSWHLYEKETHFARLAGTSAYHKNMYTKQINGKSISDSNHLIDLFAWGATGLGDYDTPSPGRAKLPDVIRQGTAGEYTWAGNNWPCYNTETMDAKGNCNITDLWGSYTYTAPIYDFGYAYMQNGRPDGDKRTYVTAPQAAYAYICDPSRSFSQGCIVKGAGLNGEDVKGALIMLGVTTPEEATEKVKEVGGIADNLQTLNFQYANTGFDFNITLPDYESIEKLGAMFFALAGQSNWASKQNLSTDCGAYWTKDGKIGSSADANALNFFFRKAQTASEFHWNDGEKSVSVTRRTQNSVRLMVEVNDN